MAINRDCPRGYLVSNNFDPKGQTNPSMDGNLIKQTKGKEENNMKNTYTPPVIRTQSVSTNYPKGVAVPFGFVAAGFAPPQKGQKFIAADALKGKNRGSSPDTRVVVAKENNSANSSARVIVTAA